MKIAVVSILAVAGLSLSACAHMSDDTAALRADEMRAELTAITEDLNTVEAVLADYRMQRKPQGVVTVTDTPNYAVQTPMRVVNWRLRQAYGLMVRRDELRGALLKAGAFTADEIRAQIQEIDAELARPQPAGLPTDTVQTSFLRPSMQSSSVSATDVRYFSNLPSDTVWRNLERSNGPRATAWTKRYRLAEERKELHAMLRAMETSEQ